MYVMNTGLGATTCATKEGMCFSHFSAKDTADLRCKAGLGPDFTTFGSTDCPDKLLDDQNLYGFPPCEIADLPLCSAQSDPEGIVAWLEEEWVRSGRELPEEEVEAQIISDEEKAKEEEEKKANMMPYVYGGVAIVAAGTIAYFVMKK